MGRRKEFDPDEVCAIAVEVFRDHGYEGTSVADLVDRLGVAKASLYSTFGSKHDLYLAALDRYVADTDATIIADLAQGDPDEAVKHLILRYARESRTSCLVVSAATELLPDDHRVTALVEKSWHTLRTALTLAFTRAGHEDADGRACLVLAFLQGLRVLGKGDGKTVRTAVDTFLKLIQTERTV
ncbi:TetR/AcrR family transcriptional regulator [Saccharothrix violaceirubra]|uniref:TetR/AcrR family transcriptional repressor of nem operon n=1 Tax=Saccharothrix violaceirubra TaxID=413306 RepID=A0A7W7WVJ3_9PSEU|nr:TetR/AcrR family transcriptional regulator [Saccharothrix violaceirubra]MBB4965131.1 TetR/AcrR family transcriptional repressor of nem operon [Saccharothrix violaceirubra]